jgi:hypothetical protein
LRFGLFPIVSVRQPLRAVANNTSRSIQSRIHIQSPWTDTKRIASRNQLPSWPPIASCTVYVIRSLTR